MKKKNTNKKKKEDKKDFNIKISIVVINKNSEQANMIYVYMFDIAFANVTLSAPNSSLHQVLYGDIESMQKMINVFNEFNNDENNVVITFNFNARNDVNNASLITNSFSNFGPNLYEESIFLQEMEFSNINENLKNFQCINSMMFRIDSNFSPNSKRHTYIHFMERDEYCRMAYITENSIYCKYLQHGDKNTMQDDWYIDFETSMSMTFNKIDFIEYHQGVDSIVIYCIFIVNGHVIKTVNTKFICLYGVLLDDTKTKVVIKNVFHVSKFISNFIFAAIMIDIGAKFNFERDGAMIFGAQNKFLLYAQKYKRQYLLMLIKDSAYLTIVAMAVNTKIYEKINDDVVDLWHRRTRHVNIDDLMRLVKMIIDMNVFKTFKKHRPTCNSCKKNKSRRRISRISFTPIYVRNECFDFDFCGPIDFQTYDGKNYFDLITCKAIDKI